MKKIICLLLFVPHIISARDFSEVDRAPSNKYEISILGGKALDMYYNYNLVGAPWGKTTYGSLSVYRNFNRWQVGLGFETDITIPEQTTNPNILNYTPHVLFNSTFEAGQISFYAGIMAGYVQMAPYKSSTLTSSYESEASGIVGGIQAGILLKVANFMALNFEVGTRASEIKSKSKSISYGNLGPGVPREISSTSGHSYFYMPFKAGFRFRI